MNSFSGVVRALEVEFARQCAVLDAGGRIEQQTMLWDANADEVRPARSKEGSHDYRYFPDPDLPPLVVPLDANRSNQGGAARTSRRAPRALSCATTPRSATVRHRRAHRVGRDGRLLRARRAPEWRSENRGELDDGRSPRRRSTTTGRRSRTSRFARPTRRVCSSSCATASSATAPRSRSSQRW